jgi:rhodanese-related sulfurtransferase
MRNFLFLPLFLLLLNSCESPAQQTKSNDTTTTEPTNEVSKPAFVDLDVEAFKKMMQQPDVVILDVRTPEETAAGKIEGAIEINVKDPSFDEKIQALDKDKTYLVYCRSGIRSVTSCGKMSDQGFKNLYNLVGGYTAWSEAQ